MKKLTTLLFLTFIGYGMTYAQTIAFTFKGKTLENEETITIKAEWDEDWEEFKGETNKGENDLLLNNLSDKEVQVSGTAKIISSDSEGATIQWCGLNGLCVAGDLTGTVNKGNVKFAPGRKDAQMLDVKFVTENYGTTKVQLTVQAGLEKRTVFINFVYSDPSGIASTENNHSIQITKGELIYNFDKNANYQLNIFNVTGVLAKSETLNQSGSVLLNNLPKGVYIYEVKENGKRIAAHKCVVE